MIWMTKKEVCLYEDEYLTDEDKAKIIDINQYRGKGIPNEIFHIQSGNRKDKKDF